MCGAGRTEACAFSGADFLRGLLTTVEMAAQSQLGSYQTDDATYHEDRALHYSTARAVLSGVCWLRMMLCRKCPLSVS
jgi:hypothetical protein